MTNSRTLSRRAFVRAAAGSAAAGLLSRSIRSGFAAGAQQPWIPAIRDAHLKLTSEPTCWAALKRLAVAGVEVQVNDDLLCPGLYEPGKAHRVATSDDRKALRDELAAHGVTITAFCMNNRLEERLPVEVEWTRRLAEAAEDLGVRAIRIDVVPHRSAPDAFPPFALKACRELCGAIKDRRVWLGIENHGHFTNDPKVLEELFHGVGSDQLGLTLDIMNFYWFGHPLNDIYELCTKFAPRTFHTHCKNLRYPAEKQNAQRPVGWEYEKHAAPLDEGDIDYGKIAGILRRAKYAGDLCLENECLGRFPKDQHVPILERELALLRKLAGETAGG